MDTAADRDINDILETIRRIVELSADGRYLFRGEAKPHEDVCSSLYDQFREHLRLHPSHNINQIQSAMLEDAKRHTGEVDPFEILTQIQHYGGKTNLIDFTTDFLVALFFACDRHFDEEGRVIFLNPALGKKFELKIPRHPENRVISQKSVFVQPTEGFIEPDKIVSIPKELKQPMLSYLRKYHGIRIETVYNDLHGFVAKQRVHDEAQREFYQGLMFANQKDYDSAIDHYTKSAGLFPTQSSTYNNRGAAYEFKGELGLAIVDYTEAIKLDSNNTASHYNRGIAYLKRGLYDEAESDLCNAKDRGFDIADGFLKDQDLSVEEFEKKYDVQLPEDIRAMLIPPQGMSG